MQGKAILCALSYLMHEIVPLCMEKLLYAQKSYFMHIKLLYACKSWFMHGKATLCALNYFMHGKATLCAENLLYAH